MATKKEETRSERIPQISVTPTLKAAILKRAKDQGRNITDQIRWELGQVK